LSLTFLIFLIGCSVSDNYQRALEIYKSSKNENRIKEAVNILRSISKDSGEYRTYKKEIEELYNKIKKNYTEIQYTIIKTKYSNSKIAYIGTDKLPYTMDISGKNITPLIEEKGFFGRCKRPRWFHDGKNIALSCHDYTRDESYNIYVIDIDEKRISRLTSNFTNEQDADWSSDNQKIIFNRNDYYTVCINLITMDETILFPKKEYEDFPGFYPIWLANDKDILFSREGTLQILRENESTPEELILKEQEESGSLTLYDLGGYYLDAELSHDDTKIVFKHNGIQILDLTTGVISPAIGGGYNPSWSPDDEYIVAFCFTPREGIYIMPTAGDEIFGDLRIYISAGSDPAWSPFLQNNN